MNDIRCKLRIGYPDSIPDRIEFIDRMATKHGWIMVEYQDNIGMMYYHKRIDNFDCRINVYLTKMSVVTYLNHPKKGKGQLYRKNVSVDLLGNIFSNPRVHSGKGYYQSNNK